MIINKISDYDEEVKEDDLENEMNFQDLERSIFTYAPIITHHIQEIIQQQQLQADGSDKAKKPNRSIQAVVCPVKAPTSFTKNENKLRGYGLDQLVQFATSNVRILQDVVFTTDELPPPHSFVCIPITFAAKPMKRFESKFQKENNLIPIHVDKHIHDVYNQIKTNSKKLMLIEGVGGVGKSFAANFVNCFFIARFSKEFRIVYIHDAEVLLKSQEKWLETFQREAIITFYDNPTLCQAILSAKTVDEVCETIDKLTLEASTQVMYMIDNFNKIDLERLFDVTQLLEKQKANPNDPNVRALVEKQSRAEAIEDFVKKQLPKLCSSVIIVASSDCETRNDEYIESGLSGDRITFEHHALSEACIKSIGKQIFKKEISTKEAKELKEFTNGIYLEVLGYFAATEATSTPAALKAFKKKCSDDYNVKLKHFIDQLKDDKDGTIEEKKNIFFANLIQMQTQKPVDRSLLMYNSWFLTFFEPVDEYSDSDYYLRPRNPLAFIVLTKYLRTHLQPFLTNKEATFLTTLQCIYGITRKHSTYGDIFEKFAIEKFQASGCRLTIKLNRFSHDSHIYPTIEELLMISADPKNQFKFNEPFVAPDAKLPTSSIILFVPRNGYHPIFDLYVLNDATLWCISFTLGKIKSHFDTDLEAGDNKTKLIKSIIEFCLKHQVKRVHEIYFTSQLRIEEASRETSLNKVPLSFQELDNLNDFANIFSDPTFLDILEKELL